MREKKFFVKADEDIEDIVEKIIDTRADKIILHIANDSVLSSSLDKFHTIKKEASRAGKEVLVESTDSTVEELADRAGLEHINPIFGKEEKIVADIIPRSKPSKAESGAEEDRKIEEFFKEQEETKKKKGKSKKSFSLPSLSLPSFSSFSLSFKWLSLGWLKQRWVGALVVLAVLAAAGFVAFRVLPRASATVTLQKTPLEVDEQVRVDVNVSSSTVAAEGGPIVLPGEIASADQNLTKRFSASEKRDVERKATGRVRIINEAVAEPVTLVATTRFKTPEGKVYNLDQETVVPAAQETSSGLEASSIQADVTASEPGKEYNIETPKDEIWRLPGFKESGLDNLYQGIYGKPVGQFDGGFIGNTLAPTDEDIEKAEEEARSALYDSLINRLMIVKSSGLKLVDGSTTFNVDEIDVNPEVDDSGKFSVFTNGSMKGMFFPEKVLEDALIKRLEEFDFPVRVVSKNLSFNNVQTDWANGTLTFNVSGQIKVEPHIDKDKLKSQIMGQDEDTLRRVIANIPNVDSAEVELWPFWVREVPNSKDKVQLNFK